MRVKFAQVNEKLKLLTFLHLWHQNVHKNKPNVANYRQYAVAEPNSRRALRYVSEAHVQPLYND